MTAVCRHCQNTGVGWDGNLCPCGVVSGFLADAAKADPTAAAVAQAQAARRPVPAAAPPVRGWVCPRCGSAWAPWVPGCERCNHPVMTATVPKESE